jgi:hypothetical protein
MVAPSHCAILLNCGKLGQPYGWGVLSDAAGDSNAGFARASDEFRTLNIQNSTFNIRQINSAIAAEVFVNHAG